MTVQDTWNAFSDILAAAAQQLELTAALVDLEGDCAEDAGDLNRVFSQFPFLSIWGGNSAGAAGINGDTLGTAVPGRSKTFREKNGKADFIKAAGPIANA